MSLIDKYRIAMTSLDWALKQKCSLVDTPSMNELQDCLSTSLR